jgi:hypothetical protein
LDKNAQRSKMVQVLSRGYVNESSGASTKARFQKFWVIITRRERIDVDLRFSLLEIERTNQGG